MPRGCFGGSPAGVAPLFADQHGGSFRPPVSRVASLPHLVPQPGTVWHGTGIAFSRSQVSCTLLARWEAGYKDPWLILTDLPPEASTAGW